MKSGSLKHEFRNVEEALKDAHKRGDAEAVKLLEEAERLGEQMLAAEIGGFIDTPLIEEFRHAWNEACEKRPDLEAWLLRPPSFYDD